MPFCTHCGIATAAGDRFCPHCGTKLDSVGAPDAASQTTPPASTLAPPLGPTPAGAPRTVRPNSAAMLCYIPPFGWIGSVFFLTADAYKQNRYVRFHALQGLFLFVAGMLADVVLGAHRFMMVPFGRMVHPWSHWTFSSMIDLAVIVIQILGIVKTIKGEPFPSPVLGELADRSMT